MQIKNKKQLVILCIAGVMAAGFVFLRYLPLRKRINKVEQAKAEQSSVITLALTESRRLPELREQLEQLRKKVENYELSIPVQRDLGEFLQRIAALMNEHNLKEQFVKPGKEIQTEKLNCIPVSMECKGSLRRIFEFYKSLQQLGRAVRIERVELVNDSDFSGEVSMRTDAGIYYRSETRQGG